MLALVVLLGGCSAPMPDDLARAVFVNELEDGVAGTDFVACVSIESKDPSRETLAELGKTYSQVVPGSECEWVMDTRKGSFHQPSGRKAMLINVHGYDARTGQVNVEARHHGLHGSRKTLRVVQRASGWTVSAVLNEAVSSAEQRHAGDARNARA